MSIVIIGGNERMVARYENLCQDYGCKAKVFVKEHGLSGSASFIYEYGFPQDGHECFSGSKKK